MYMKVSQSNQMLQRETGIGHGIMAGNTSLKSENRQCGHLLNNGEMVEAPNPHGMFPKNVNGVSDHSNTVDEEVGSSSCHYNHTVEQDLRNIC